MLEFKVGLRYSRAFIATKGFVSLLIVKTLLGVSHNLNIVIVNLGIIIDGVNLLLVFLKVLAIQRYTRIVILRIFIFFHFDYSLKYLITLCLFKWYVMQKNIKDTYQIQDILIN